MAASISKISASTAFPRTFTYLEQERLFGQQQKIFPFDSW